MSANIQSTASRSTRESTLSRLWPLIAAAALGVAILYVVGFAGSHTIHEAAHDTRHSMNFPCH